MVLPRSRTLELTRLYQWGIIIVLVIFFVNLGLRVGLSFAFDTMSAQQEACMGIIDGFLTGSFGALIGMVGGKVA